MRKCTILGVHEFVHEKGMRMWYFMGFYEIVNFRKMHIFHNLGFYGIVRNGGSCFLPLRNKP